MEWQLRKQGLSRPAVDAECKKTNTYSSNTCATFRNKNTIMELRKQSKAASGTRKQYTLELSRTTHITSAHHLHGSAQGKGRKPDR
jgi:hypothetical protein